MTDPSPAERYSAFRSRRSRSPLRAFTERLPFDLDPFQRQACEALDDDHSVLVSAPTGSGKTVVAEFAVFRALADPDAKVFYTTPMKALSNQKYRELAAEHGVERVGLLTGDTSRNARARIVVMTTEILRNMLYEGSDLLDGLATVVLDEVHFLADRFRGAVWEEIILQLPRDVRLVSLSATVSNAREFGQWLELVRGTTDVVVAAERPVPLNAHVLVRSRLTELFDPRRGAPHVNPELLHLSRSAGARRPGRPGRGRGRARAPAAGRVETALLLAGLELLPAISFTFGRQGCDDAVTQLARAGVSLTSSAERRLIRTIAHERCRSLGEADLAVLGHADWLDGLERGIAAHHAGLIPVFKETVEILFQRRLVKLVFATETLALGINMPARTVVLERLDKFNGEARVPITAGEYTQLTGRAGRRGIDAEGHAVIRWRDDDDPHVVADLVTRGSHPLVSSFRPDYNMTVNLVERHGREGTREVLESSYAQFQADHAVVSLARTVRGQEESLAGYEESMRCHLGDFREYAALRRELTDLERRRAPRGDETARRERARALERLRSRLRAHPCHVCPDREQHARWAERWWRLHRKTAALRRRIRGSTGAIATAFDRVTEVLITCGYLEETAEGTVLTEPGRLLRRIHSERDLLVAECLRRGLWDALDAPSLAAVACALAADPRREAAGIAGPRLPGAALRRAFEASGDAWSRLDDVERAAGLPGSAPLSAGSSRAMHAWARGVGLGGVLTETDLAPGDFVRRAKQTIDLLDQVSLVAPPATAATARRARDAVCRGIVAHSAFD